MHNGSSQIVQKLWNYCNVLRDDGLSYGDYVEQLTYLLFLKMAHEQTQPPWSKPSVIPKGYDWPALDSKDGDDLETHYRKTLVELGKQSGMLGVIFRKAQNKIQDPAKLRRLIVDLIDKEQWSSLSADVKGDAYEGLLQKNAEDVKGGAGQYFTPRPLIAAMVDVIAPQPNQSICDPACGTGGFLLAAHDYVAKHYQLDRAQKKKLKSGTFFGIELVDSVARLCCMNLLLHGIGESGAGVPPAGKGGSSRDGRAPLEDDVHTLLRLPTGIFYAQGVKANVLCFDRKPAQEKPWTQKLWIYDLRTNLHFTLKENTLKRSDLDDFVGCYFGAPTFGPARAGSE